MPEVIGGFFDIDITHLNQPVCQRFDQYFRVIRHKAVKVNSGRGALSMILSQISRLQGEVLLPDYLCGDIFFALFESKGIKFRLYPVANDCSVTLEVLERYMTKNTHSVLLINYFGLVNQAPLIHELKIRHENISVILDCVQDPYYYRNLNKINESADFVFTSFRKTFGVTDGGLISGSKMEQPSSFLKAEDKKTNDLFMCAGILKHVDLSDESNSQIFIDYYNAGQQRLGYTPRNMSLISQKLMSRYSLDLIAQRRRSNYCYVADALKNTAGIKVLKPKLSSEDVPLCCPVFIEGDKRDQLRKILRKDKIFCPVHWPLNSTGVKLGIKQSNPLYKNMLSLVIDQRYKEDGLARMVDAIKNAIR